MRKDDPSQIRTVYVGFKPAEFSRFEQQYKKTTCRTMSEYIRSALFGKKITTLYRNQSLDDLIEEMVITNQQITAIESTIEKAVVKLYSCPETGGLEEPLYTLQAEVKKLGKKIKKIKNHFEKITQEWLQS